MNSFFDTHRQRLGHLLVALQFGLLLQLMWAAAPVLTEGLPTPSCLLLATLSLALAGWTLAHNRLGNFNIHPAPKPQGSLVTTGPYRWIRHPMYSAVLLGAAALAVLLDVRVGAVTWLALVGDLWVKATLEERWLCEHYANYAHYCQRTWRFIPWLL